MTGDREAYFWNTQGGAELDLLVFVRGQRYGVEFKYADAPTVTRSLRVAREEKVAAVSTSVGPAR